MLGNVVGLLRANNFALNSFDCSTSSNGTELTTNSKPATITQFESQLNEMVSSNAILQMYKNSTNSIEFYLKVSIFGRDGNELPIPSDESPILTELAMIDNNEFSLTTNVSLKGPRRFFRVGIAWVNSIKLKKK